MLTAGLRDALVCGPAIMIIAESVEAMIAHPKKLIPSPLTWLAYFPATLSFTSRLALTKMKAQKASIPKA